MMMGNLRKQVIQVGKQVQRLLPGGGQLEMQQRFDELRPLEYHGKQRRLMMMIKVKAVTLDLKVGYCC